MTFTSLVGNTKGGNVVFTSFLKFKLKFLGSKVDMKMVSEVVEVVVETLVVGLLVVEGFRVVVEIG